jgi:uncharacterized membrane protein YfcA
MIEYFNIWMSLILGCFVSVAIMSPHFRDGIIIKIGLSFCAIGFFGMFLSQIDHRDSEALRVANAMVHLGVLICAIGYAYRVYKHKHRNRRVSDWFQ